MTDSEPFFDKTANTGFRHLISATRFSIQGLSAAIRKESAFRQELAVIGCSTPIAVWIASSLQDFLLLMVVSFIVLITELLNSAVEATVDRIGVEYHPLSGLAKDYCSAAVMLSLTLAGIVWLAMLARFFF